MATTTTRRLAIFLGLALVMGVTRFHPSLLNHALWDASWGVFFLAGFWLRGQGRWAFPLLMAEAVLVDYLVINGQGIDFWSHYCMSPAYWFLLPAYGALWLGGSWLAKRQQGLSLATLGLAVAALLVAEGLCYLISNGSFYWISASVPLPRSFGAWFANLGDWYLPFLTGTAAYVALGAVLHALATQLARTAQRSGHAQR
ncbi:MAG: hypothetical protein BGP10_09420 [Rhodanobacter sp. 68-29]|uniref:hypothetical protein n=1 Tax=Rhodanobacter sp. PCA2 TaxID=2006117 RepID=UPI00086F8026|nr:hypothetical protein [Rhodanobacter sp. PCA2]MBA2079328.1 hypothetical protein [Rhodanobacter sp. PCA2]MBN8924288.1 hypothetical protein [Rhodanobacter sp.]ODU73984.1 MAG: hypothetical protein ABT17_09800 [Rhodanobacter sp. SCN 69-32]OJY59121.1 MAG: hypothetical protein BGP10_09420 [Rhodanobacter sp. 68-29]